MAVEKKLENTQMLEHSKMTHRMHNWYFAHTLYGLIWSTFMGPGICWAIDPGESGATPLQPAAIPIPRFRPVSIHILRQERPAHNKHSSITVTPHFVIATQPCGRLLQISISHRPVSIVYERASERLFRSRHFLRALGTKHRLPAITPAIIFPPLTASWAAASAQSKASAFTLDCAANGADTGAPN